MDAISLIMFLIPFILAIVFMALSISGFYGAVSGKRPYEPIDDLWCWLAMACWFFMAIQNPVFATDIFFIGYSWFYVGLGFVFMVLGFYGIFLSIHVSSEMKEQNEMRLH